jgi:hypothetical protein
MAIIEWKESPDGNHLESKCERFRIHPVFLEHETPQYFFLEDKENTFLKRFGETLVECMRKAEEEMQRPSMTREQIEEYLRNAENKAIKSLAQNKWERFGYWASQSVHLRRLLGLSRTRSPFRPFADLARQMVDAQSE